MVLVAPHGRAQYIRQDTAAMLRPDTAVAELLAALPQPKWILTNCREARNPCRELQAEMSQGQHVRLWCTRRRTA